MWYVKERLSSYTLIFYQDIAAIVKKWSWIKLIVYGLIALICTILDHTSAWCSKDFEVTRWRIYLFNWCITDQLISRWLDPVSQKTQSWCTNTRLIDTEHKHMKIWPPPKKILSSKRLHCCGITRIVYNDDQRAYIFRQDNKYCSVQSNSLDEFW